jgi:hypothetical protein
MEKVLVKKIPISKNEITSKKSKKYLEKNSKEN